MNKFAKSIILILLVLTLVFAVVACNKDTTEDETDEQGSQGASGAVPVTEPIDKSAVFSRITSGLTLADRAVAKQTHRHVNSCYEAIVNKINLTVTYEADYDFERTQDSEIMLKLFDNQYQRNTVFVYYYKGNLYYEYKEEKSVVEGFGGTSTFDVFFDLIRSFDMESYFFTEDFAETFNSMSIFAEASNMSVRSISDTEERIEIKDVNLDRIKNNVNKFMKQMFGAPTLGTKIDALSQALLGCKISEVSEVEIGLFNASNVQVIIRDGIVTDFDITFDGTQSNNVSTYYLDISYSTTTVSSRVTLNRFDDPDLNVYKVSRASEQYWSGVMNVPAIDADFNVGIYANLTTGDNSGNSFLVDIRTKTDEALEESDPHYIDTSILYLYYINGVLYVNADGLMRYYIGNGIDLKALGFPYVKTSELNVSQQLSSVVSELVSYVTKDLTLEAIMGSIDFNWEDTTVTTKVSEESLIDPETPLGILLANSQSDGDKLIVTIDDKFIGAAVGDYETDVIEWIASTIGINRSIIEAVMGEDFFKEVTLVLTIDMSNGDVSIDFNTANGTLFTIDLTAQDIPDTGIVIPEPKGFTPANYTEFEMPQEAVLHLEGEIRMQGKSSVDLSKFFGAFIGDITGVNTPYTFEVKDRFYLSLDAWTVNDNSYVSCSLWANPTYNGELSASTITSKAYITIYTSPANPDTFLINYTEAVGYKYQISREGLLEAFNELLGDDNIFSYDNVMDIFRSLISSSNILMNEDHIAFTLAPYQEDGKDIDPIFEYIGVDSMIADLKAQVKFTAPSISVAVNTYSIPEFETLPDLAFLSMYEAHWHESVTVAFDRDSAVKDFKLTFAGESAKLVTGKYYYLPEAKLFGKTISYAMILTDTVNGTKAIDRLEMSKLVIDPSVENAIPDRIGVIYDDGTLGSQKFEILNFPYTNGNINYALSGATAKNYEVVIGPGSINEVHFTLPVEILNRVIIPYEFRDGIPYDEPTTEDDRTLWKERWTNAYVGEVPVVKVVHIDPYTYALNKLEAQRQATYSGTPLDVSLFSPIGTDLTLYFNSANSDAIVTENLVDFDWAFDESLISYQGGVYYQYAYYNTIQIAMRVEVEAKVVDYIQIVGERPGNYTVDSLVAASYTIPVETDARAEVRIYFKTGHYRIVGKEPEGFEASDIYCDGYYPQTLNWKYPKATNVSLDSSINPLNYGLTNVNTTTFGDNVAGKQDITLIVYSPSRRLENLADNVQAITYLSIDAVTGDILEDETVRESVRVSSVGLGQVGGTFDKNGAYFILDPYASGEGKRLPSTITMDVEYAGSMTRKAYEVTWIESSIIDAQGYVKNPTAEENLLIAEGWIGETETNRQKVTVVIHNLSGKYDSMIIVDPNTGSRIVPSAAGDYVITINPYDNYKLPTSFSLEFKEEDGSTKTLTYSTDWQINLGDGEIPLPANYKFPYKGGEFVVTTYVEASAAEGILAQKVDLIVAVLEKVVIPGKIYGLSDTMTAEDDSVDYFLVDPYTASSHSLEQAILSLSNVGVSFKDGTKMAGGIPVVWINHEEALEVLNNEGGTSNYPNEIFTLRGYIHRHSEALEQEISVSFRVLKKEVRSVALTNWTENDSSNGISDVKIDIANRTMDIQILKPFILSAGIAGDQVAPSVYLNYLFDAIRIAFEDDSYGTFDLGSDAIPEDLDVRAFTYSGSATKSLVTFKIPRLGPGSRVEDFTVNVYTTKDTLVTDALYESIETFELNGGTPKYSTGYNIPSSIEVEFKYSGKVTYTGITWYAKSNYSDAGGILLSVNQPVPDQNIPASLFKTMTGNTIWLYAKLNNANNMEINKTFIFLAKDIKETLYDAEAENPYYTIRSGTINIANIYNVYPFDVSMLPTTIIPHTGSQNADYQIEEVVRFGITWIPAPEFAKDDDSSAFDQEKINARFTFAGYTGSGEDYLATALIRMYDSEVQTIKLYVNVAPLFDGKISHKDIEVTSEIGDIAGEAESVMLNHVVIDPYENNFGGNYVFPKDITVTFDTEVYTFAKTANITYYIRNQNNAYVEKTSIPYTHLGHDLGAEFGAPTDTLYIWVKLPDEQILYMDITFNSRELEGILVPNKATKVEGGVKNLDHVYYIDPYDEETYQVPMKAEFYFLVGDNSLLNISYWDIAEAAAPFDSNYRFVAKGNFYQGGIYTFSSSLSGYGVAAQEFTITIIVLNRSLAERESGDNNAPYKNTYDITNPIATIASDVPASLTVGSFVSIEGGDYTLYNEISTPVLPTISWKIKNDDIVYTGMKNAQFAGNVKYGNIAGEVTHITINAPAWDFAYIDDSMTEGIDGYIINFNTYTGESVAKQVVIDFYVDGGPATTGYTFYPTEHVDGNENKARSVIDWMDTTVGEHVLRTFTIGNLNKSLVIKVEKRYFYRYTQVPVTEVDFGYGYGASNYAELVIDPLNPIIPTEVLARGREPDADPSSDFVELGYIPVVFESAIYNMPYEGNEQYTMIEATLTTSSGDDVKFNVKVYYLDRTPLSVKTSSPGFSSAVSVPGKNEFTLSTYNTNTKVSTSYFQIDPVAVATYDATTGKYRLPEDLIFAFKSTYSNATMNAAIKALGYTFTYTNLTWKLSREISLKGTDETNDAGVVISSNPIVATIIKGDMSYKKNQGDDNETVISCGTKTYQNGMDSRYNQNLKVINREVEYTSVSERVLASDGTGYQKALSQYYIDPYEEGYLSSFPETIVVKYTNTQEQRITVENWEFDEEYLKRPDVISGLILEHGGTPESMTVMANIKVYGTKISIQFPIKARNIVTTMVGGEGTMPLAGGTIYVLKGQALRPQLPTSMYYRFEYDGEIDITSVPLIFSENNLFGVSTDKAGMSYTVLGTLGGINVDNIEFNVVVIDPEVFTTRDSEDEVKKGSFYYDYLEVARNTAGFYTAGKEAGLLPERIFVNDDGDYLIVEKVTYDLTSDGIYDGYATFYCKYVFNDDASVNLSGNATGEGDDANRLAISFKVPLMSYDYTIVDSTMPLEFNVVNYDVELGSVIKASDMPCAYDGDGKEYRLMWDMREVDTNLAGVYNAYGYYLNNAAKNNVVSMTISVKQHMIDAGDVQISRDWTNRVYTGKVVPLDDYITITTFLRADGTIDQVQGFSVLYSVDEGVSWQTNQPIRVGSFKVKITINDYNIFGSVVMSFTINKATIPANSITFHEDDESPAIQEDLALAFSYTGEAMKPLIRGLIDDINLEYQVVYEKRGSWNDSINDWNYEVVSPVNVGVYRVSVIFPDQRDYYSAQTYTLVYSIVAKEVVYTIQREMTYNGLERDVVVNGLPLNPTAAGVKVKYTYYSPLDLTKPLNGKVKNVGTYLVTVEIDGGENYPSANANGIQDANLVLFEFKILPKEVIININELESEYLDDIKPLSSAVTITDADNPEVSGLQGADTIALFLNVLNVFCPDEANGVLTNKHMVNDRNDLGTGGYRLMASIISDAKMPSNYTVNPSTGYKEGRYYITATNGAKVINNKIELDNAIAQLRDNQDVKWYLRGGSYGTITINKNASVSIVGSYDLISDKVAVEFTAINVVKGGVTVDIVNFRAISRTACISIGADASSLTVNRTSFVRGGSAYLTGSVAIASAPGFKGSVTVTNSTIYGYTTGVYLRGGSLSMSNSTIDTNIIGVQVQDGNMVLLNNAFLYNRGEAVYNVSMDGDISINNNTFIGNAVGVKSHQKLMNDIVVQNTFSLNAKNTKQV